MRKIYAVFLVALMAVGGCKKDKNASPQDNGPTTSLNGWSYHGKVYSATDSKSGFQLYLEKVHEHSGGILDVFYGVKVEELNYFGTGSPYFTRSRRWLLKSDGTTIRQGQDLAEFTTQAGYLIQRHKEIDILPIDVEVFGTGAGEFKIYSPVDWLKNYNFPGNSGIPEGIFHYSGSASPRTILSSPFCFLYDEDIKVETQAYWGSFNMFMAKHPSTNQYFVIHYQIDSQLFIINLVSPQNVNSPSGYGTVRYAQPMFGKTVTQLIPQWNTNYTIDRVPLYYQYTADPENLYFILQNKEQLFLMKFNLNTFKFSIAHEYSQPRINPDGYEYGTNRIQFVDREAGAFLLTEKRQSGCFAMLHRNGATQTLALPDFKQEIAKAVMDIRYDNGKFWMIVMDNNRNVYLFSKNY
ncbi:MAG: hypothetical protein RML37_12415 [Chitinophagales bacterium]|nr:hypothetical protein [Chitinophagales bacterium]